MSWFLLHKKHYQLTRGTSTDVVNRRVVLIADCPVLTVVVFTHAGLGVVGQGEGSYLAVPPCVTIATHTLVTVSAVPTSSTVLAYVGLAFIYVCRTVLAAEAWPAVTSGGRNGN